MNNMGGITSCELIPLSSVSVFSVVVDQLALTLASGKEWELLPIRTGRTRCEATPEKDGQGIVYKHNFETILPTGKYNPADLPRWRNIARAGCLVRYVDHNGRCRVLGTKDYPLTGTVEEVSGESASDLSGLQFSLSAICLTPALSI